MPVPLSPFVLLFCLCSSRSESYWTAVVGEFDITKTDPDEQVLKVNRIIPHPKVILHTVHKTLALLITFPQSTNHTARSFCKPLSHLVNQSINQPIKLFFFCSSTQRHLTTI